MSNRSSWRKSTVIFWDGRELSTQNLALIWRKRVIVDKFPPELLEDGLPPKDTLIQDYVVTFFQTKPVSFSGRADGLYVIAEARAWEKESKSFLVRFRPATLEEETTYSVIHG